MLKHLTFKSPFTRFIFSEVTETEGNPSFSQKQPPETRQQNQPNCAVDEMFIGGPRREIVVKPKPRPNNVGCRKLPAIADPQDILEPEVKGDKEGYCEDYAEVLVFVSAFKPVRRHR
jgi:hypothetical protein